MDAHSTFVVVRKSGSVFHLSRINRAATAVRQSGAPRAWFAGRVARSSRAC